MDQSKKQVEIPRRRGRPSLRGGNFSRTAGSGTGRMRMVSPDITLFQDVGNGSSQRSQRQASPDIIIIEEPDCKSKSPPPRRSRTVSKPPADQLAAPMMSPGKSPQNLGRKRNASIDKVDTPRPVKKFAGDEVANYKGKTVEVEMGDVKAPDPFIMRPCYVDLEGPAVVLDCAPGSTNRGTANEGALVSTLPSPYDDKSPARRLPTRKIQKPGLALSAPVQIPLECSTTSSNSDPQNLRIPSSTSSGEFEDILQDIGVREGPVNCMQLGQEEREIEKTREKEESMENSETKGEIIDVADDLNIIAEDNNAAFLDVNQAIGVMGKVNVVTNRENETEMNVEGEDLEHNGDSQSTIVSFENQSEPSTQIEAGKGADNKDNQENTEINLVAQIETEINSVGQTVAEIDSLDKTESEIDSDGKTETESLLEGKEIQKPTELTLEENLVEETGGGPLEAHDTNNVSESNLADVDDSGSDTDNDNASTEGESSRSDSNNAEPGDKRKGCCIV